MSYRFSFPDARTALMINEKDVPRRRLCRLVLTLLSLLGVLHRLLAPPGGAAGIPVDLPFRDCTRN